MKNTVIKYRILLSLEKELAFINKMNQQGYRLEGVFDSFYRFKKTEEEHFTIARAAAKREVASVTAQAAEQGLRRISVWGHTPHELLYFDGVKGEANEGFFESEECREAQRKGMQTHYCVNSCVLFGLFAFIVGWAFWGQMVSLPKIVSVWEAHGGIPGEYRWLLALYGMMVVLSVAGLAFLGCLSVGSLRLWHRAAKENGKGKQVLWIQVLLWLLIIPLLLGVYILEKPAEEVEDEPTLEELREQAVLFEDYDYSMEKLGECYYFYGEYESDLLFEDVKPLLEEKGYRLEDFGNLLEEGDDSIYYMAVNDASESTIFVLECVTEEQAKKVYTLALEDSWEYMYHIHANYNYTVTRMGRMVYGTAYNDAAFPDLMGLYELPLPEPVPLYKGGKYTYWGNVGFEQAVTTAGRLKYTSYGYNEMLDEVFEDCRNFLTPDGRGYLSIVKLKSAEVGIEGEIPQDDKVLLWLYQVMAELGFELFGNPFEQESMKYVMLSKDTFIAGTSYYVDAFIAELEK